MAGIACRACGVDLDPSLVDADGTGLHPTCRVAPAPVLPELYRVLARHQQGSERSRQRVMGPSEIGNPCDRALAYSLVGVEKVNDEPLKWAPLVGTWGHAGIAEAYSEENARLGRERYLIERRVPLPAESVVRGGRVDLFDLDTGEVIDWKFVGKTRMTHYRRHGPGSVYRTQAHTYGLGYERLGYDPVSVRIVFLPKWSAVLSDGYEWAEPYDSAVALGALSRVEAVRSLADALDVARHPERFALIATGDEPECTYCPWLRPWHTDDANAPASSTGCPGLSKDPK